ncbi:MAG: endonuclease/exonuclease/phosphatase family protein [Flavobacterium sp.]|nr:endonuclease/exonuclease/phosphatase family protein [Flavobacterium sp.]
MLFYIFSILIIVSSLIPLVQNSHWFFRVFEFGKVQLFVLLVLTSLLGLIFTKNKETLFFVVLGLNLLTIIFHAKDLFPYTKLHASPNKKKTIYCSETISIISANIYQDNTSYNKFINLIEKHNPDIFLTMESNQNWENALSHFDISYPFHVKVALENTYGIHFYSRLKIISHQVHYFVADDIPSIDAKIESKDGFIFNFFGVHPPPPSPTEEENAKERDGELLSVAKVVKTKQDPCLVVGDFNNVAWAKSSLLFRKTSELIDARIGRGLFSTFHANYWFFRFPIDLLFHSTDVFIEELRTLSYFGSDHFPIYTSFHINKQNSSQEELIDTLEQHEKKEISQMIEEGINEESENRE